MYEEQICMLNIYTLFKSYLNLTTESVWNNELLNKFVNWISFVTILVTIFDCFSQNY